jgi:hypothetical protein
VRADGTGRGATWTRTNIAPAEFKKFLQSALDTDLEINRSAQVDLLDPFTESSD